MNKTHSFNKVTIFSHEGGRINVAVADLEEEEEEEEEEEGEGELPTSSSTNEQESNTTDKSLGLQTTLEIFARTNKRTL